MIYSGAHAHRPPLPPPSPAAAAASAPAAPHLNTSHRSSTPLHQPPLPQRAFVLIES